MKVYESGYCMRLQGIQTLRTSRFLPILKKCARKLQDMIAWSSKAPDEI